MNPALTTLLPLLAGGHFSLLAPLGEIQFARRAHRAALTGWGGGGNRPSPFCSTQWDVYGLASPSCHPTCTGCRWRAHLSVCQDPASVRRGYAGWPRGRRHQSAVRSVQQLGMVGLRNQSHHENTEGERVKPDQTARDSAYWLGRITRALIVRGARVEESARPDG